MIGSDLSYKHALIVPMIGSDEKTLNSLRRQKIRLLNGL